MAEKMSWKKVKNEVIDMVDERITALQIRNEAVRERVSLYLDEDVRAFTWGVRKMLLLDLARDPKYCDDEGITIFQLIDDIETRSNTLMELLELRKDMQKIGKS